MGLPEAACRPNVASSSSEDEDESSRDGPRWRLRLRKAACMSPGASLCAHTGSFRVMVHMLCEAANGHRLGLQLWLGIMESWMPCLMPSSLMQSGSDPGCQQPVFCYLPIYSCPALQMCKVHTRKQVLWDAMLGPALVQACCELAVRCSECTSGVSMPGGVAGRHHPRLRWPRSRRSGAGRCWTWRAPAAGWGPPPAYPPCPVSQHTLSVLDRTM